jgi:hypothetical protein
VEIDIKNSQPFMSLALLNKSFWKPNEKDFGKKFSLKYLLDNIYKDIKYNTIIMFLKTDETQSCIDIQKYKNLVLSAKYYEYNQEFFQPLYPTRFSNRNDTKTETLRIMYSNPEHHNKPFYKPCQTYKEHFPSVYELFTTIQNAKIITSKKEKRNYLPLILQKIESFLVIDIICKKISELHPQIPLFTVHDSIITTKENEGTVKEIMTSEIENWIGYLPRVEIKDLMPSNVLEEASKLHISNMPLKIVDTCSGEQFDSIEEAAEIYKIEYTKLKIFLSEDFSNPTCLRYMAA